MPVVILPAVLAMLVSDVLTLAVDNTNKKFRFVTAMALEGNISTTLRNSITTALTKVSIYTT